MVVAGNLETLSVSTLKGVGAKTLIQLDKLGIRCVQDLLFHLPFRYEDRTTLRSIIGIRSGDHALVEGIIASCEILPKGRRALVCRIDDGTGFLNLKFFHYSSDQASRLKNGLRLRCYGEVKEGFYGLEMTHPDYQSVDGEASCADDYLTPVYPLTEGIHQKTLRRLIAQALLMLEGLVDWIPEGLLRSLDLPSLQDALQLLHKAPVNGAFDALEKAQKRLSFEELLAHHLSLSQFRGLMRSQCAHVLNLPESSEQKLIQALPFALTSAQKRVIQEIKNDLLSAKPMMRLVQGDVGSGKTVVAAFAALAALRSGFQVAVMAPTELLAEQHYRSFSAWLKPLGIQLAFLGGKLKTVERREALEAILTGQASTVIGTHALFQEQVKFSNLGLVVIDEQHRFGVHQRLALREKAQQEGFYPHQLIMTATPIPRTLAMLGYADLDISIIDELPPGRTPVNTVVIPSSRRPEVIERIETWAKSGRQVYWVCTLIEESEVLECEAAENTAESLTHALPNLRIGLIHGRLKPGEKDSIMAEFKAGHIDLLVATTVIEVGVDVPNAGLMIIENPERLGLAQLHQLRGRVGRGIGESHCLLMFQPPLSKSAKERLSILRETNDGFMIAERDLALRGPGELLGVKQTGLISFRIADLSRDGDLLDWVKNTAETLLASHPDSVDPLLRRWLSDSIRYVEV